MERFGRKDVAADAAASENDSADSEHSDNEDNNIPHSTALSQH